MKVMTISVVSDSEEITKEIIVDDLRTEDLNEPISLDSIERVEYSQHSVDVYFNKDVMVSTNELFHMIDRHEQVVFIAIQ